MRESGLWQVYCALGVMPGNRATHVDIRVGKTDTREINMQAINSFAIMLVILWLLADGSS